MILMENDLQKLPIGIQSFKKLKTNNYLYVDKTKDIYNLILEGANYFLSRPRRFGKSLLISTLENLFLGNKELFKDLYIYDKWNWNETYPVIRIDFGGGILRSGDDLKYYLIDVIEEIAELYNITLKHKIVDGKFRELIKNLYGKYGKVVVLVDEYDKPVLDNISYPTVRDEMKEILHDFYQILKSQDDNIF
ncbi:MAG: hypothetical protein SAMD00024442_19_10 partial [Methanobrevibacter sp. CfCl-M3]